MADFAGYEEWSLQAIVRGFSNEYTHTTNNINNSQQTCSLIMQQNDHDHDLLFAFNDVLDPKMCVFDDGLETIYNPFYQVSSSKHVKENPDQEVGEEKKIEEEEKESCIDELSSENIAIANYVPKYKRRKNQHRTVVMQVAAEGLSCDMWAWRKYGQKPIKGSPYPRSYYRCSSKKGCLARKQVEQNFSDPSMFIITYTGEHCHNKPTRKNSLAGTTRNKFSTPKNNSQKTKDSITSSSSSEVISPKSSLISSTDEEEIFKTKVKPENVDEDEEQIVQWGSRNEFDNLDILMDDDFFVGLETLDGTI